MQRLSEWWRPTSKALALASEDRLFAHVRAPRDTYDVPVRVDWSRRVAPTEANLHTTRVPRVASRARGSMVMLHGYGAGGALFYRNIDAIARAGYDCYTVDMVGNALSSRPRFECRDREETEALQVESIEAWRAASGIDKVVLLGHSFGGYMAACYALKYPKNVEALVLVSPVGVPEMPTELKDPFASRGILLRTAVGAFRAAWSAGLTPQAVIRLGGPKGRSWIQAYVDRRFVDTADKAAIGEYLYHTAVMDGSGEYALQKVLGSFVFARHPLAHRLHELKVPVLFLYGSQDWMDSSHAAEVLTSLNVPARLMIVPQSGHQLFIDNPDAFNLMLLEGLETLQRVD